MTALVKTKPKKAAAGFDASAYSGLRYVPNKVLDAVLSVLVEAAEKFRASCGRWGDESGQFASSLGNHEDFRLICSLLTRIYEDLGPNERVCVFVKSLQIWAEYQYQQLYYPYLYEVIELYKPRGFDVEYDDFEITIVERRPRERTKKK